MTRLLSEGMRRIRRRLRRGFMIAAATLWAGGGVAGWLVNSLPRHSTASEVLELLGRTSGWLAIGAFAAALLVVLRGGVLRSGSARLVDDERKGVLIESGETETFVRLEDIERGWSWRNFRDQEILSLGLHSGDEWRIRAPDVEDAMLFLEALGLDASKRKVRVRRRKTGTFGASALLSLVPLVGYFIFFVPAGNALDSRAVTMGVFFFWIQTLLALLWKLQPSPLEIGTDGVGWRRWWNPRFVPHRDLASAKIEKAPATRTERWQLMKTHGLTSLEASDPILVLELQGGERVAVPIGPIPPDRMVAIERRIEEAAAGGELDADEIALLVRGGRGVEEWKKALGELSLGGFRQARIPHLRLRQIFENAHADAERRLGAAIALSKSEGKDERQQIRVRVAELAEEVADPALARAFSELAADALSDEAVARVGRRED